MSSETMLTILSLRDPVSFNNVQIYKYVHMKLDSTGLKPVCNTMVSDYLQAK